MRLQDKVVAITGGGSGIGRATALLFAREGADVAVIDLDGDKANETVASIKEQNSGSAIAIQADVSDETAARNMIDTTVEELGRIDVLYNNAGLPMSSTPVEEVGLDFWNKLIEVNLTGPFLGSKFAVPHMKRQGGGVILITASMSGIRARPGLSAYCATKGGAILLGKELAIELAPHNIRVNAICPVAADTPMLPKFSGIGGAAPDDAEEAKRQLVSTIPIGKLATAEDVAYAALYLASDEAGFITGITLDVDGGRGI